MHAKNANSYDFAELSLWGQQYSLLAGEKKDIQVEQVQGKKICQSKLSHEYGRSLRFLLSILMVLFGMH